MKGKRTVMAQAEGYGDRAGMSRHTATVIQRVRAEDMPDTPEDQRKEMLIMTTYNLLSNNSAQNPFHAVQVCDSLRDS